MRLAETTCPNCGSTRVRRREDGGYICLNCDHGWEELTGEIKMKRQADKLPWPRQRNMDREDWDYTVQNMTPRLKQRDPEEFESQMKMMGIKSEEDLAQYQKQIPEQQELEKDDYRREGAITKVAKKLLAKGETALAQEVLALEGDEGLTSYEFEQSREGKAVERCIEKIRAACMTMQETINEIYGGTPHRDVTDLIEALEQVVLEWR